MTMAKPKQAKPKVEKKKDTIEYWQEMIAHIDTTFTRKKGSKYPFSPRDFVLLKTYAKLYMPWGVMALWDCFINSDDPFYRNTGHKIAAFASGLPKLLDMDWKSRAESYRKLFHKDTGDIFQMVGKLANAKTF